MRDNLISKNYATYTVRNKPRRSPEVPVLTKEEQHILINNLPFNPIGVLIRTALGTGARLGELLGLSLKDIDFENNIIHIRNGVVRENLFTADGKLGHSTVTITMDIYSHVMPEQKKEAIERIKGIM